MKTFSNQIQIYRLNSTLSNPQSIMVLLCLYKEWHHFPGYKLFVSLFSGIHQICIPTFPFDLPTQSGTFNVISLTSLKIALPICLLLSFLHNRIPCKNNAWADDNLTPPNKPNKSKNHTSNFLYYLLFVKMEFYFYLDKN